MQKEEKPKKRPKGRPLGPKEGSWLLVAFSMVRHLQKRIITYLYLRNINSSECKIFCYFMNVMQTGVGISL